MIIIIAINVVEVTCIIAIIVADVMCIFAINVVDVMLTKDVIIAVTILGSKVQNFQWRCF